MSGQGRAVLVTGCSSGIGRACALALKERGYRVLATARRPEDLDGLEREGLDAVSLELADPASVRAAAEGVLAATDGRLYGLFNNAAYGLPGAVEDLSREALRDQFEVNLFGTHDLTRRLLPAMRAQGVGRIVQNSSVLGLFALRYRGAYVATKFALEGLTDALRLELLGTGIAVSLIEPGPILSRFRENAYSAYRRYIDPTHSPHRSVYEAMERRLTMEGPTTRGTLPAEAVVPKLVHALESPRPKVRYYVTWPTYLLAGARRVLPYRWLDAVALRVAGG